jgi:predicted Rossmann fold nucleotide-binding protein DprA/Smf involved in DNA uptake
MTLDTQTGFTGTRKGTTKAQHDALFEVMSHLSAGSCWLHGDCVGADAESHAFARQLGLIVEIYPSTIVALRAYCQDAQFVHTPQMPLERNRSIVNASSRLIATPDAEESRKHQSGTWMTVRFARRLGRPITLIFSDGSIQEERHEPPTTSRITWETTNDQVLDTKQRHRRRDVPAKLVR